MALNYTVLLFLTYHRLRWQEFWPKHVRENITIEVHK